MQVGINPNEFLQWHQGGYRIFSICWHECIVFHRYSNNITENILIVMTKKFAIHSFIGLSTWRALLPQVVIHDSATHLVNFGHYPTVFSLNLLNHDIVALGAVSREPRASVKLRKPPKSACREPERPAAALRQRPYSGKLLCTQVHGKYR